MKTRKALLYIIVPALLAGACKKSKDDEGQEPVGPQQLFIKLNSNYLPADKVDSATARWELNGNTQLIRMELSNDTLKAPLEQFAEGNGKLTIQLFSRIQLERQDLQWEKRWDLSLEHKKAINIQGPASYTDVDWMPRVILIQGAAKFTVIVGLRPEDPYFSMHNMPAAWPQIEMERGYFKIPGGVEFAGYGYYKCMGGFGANFENRTFFAKMGEMVGVKPWVQIAIGIGLFNDNPADGGYTLWFSHITK